MEIRIRAPKARPIIWFERLEFWVTRHKATSELILRIAVRWYQASPLWITCNVFSNCFKRGFLSFVVAKYVVERLQLEATVELLQNQIQLLAKIPHCYSLIRVFGDSCPQQVDMVRHAAVDGAAEAVAKCRVGKNFAKLVIEGRNEPTSFAALDG